MATASGDRDTEATGLISLLLSSSTDSFAALGLQPSPSICTSSVRSAFRKRALVVHPDKCKHSLAEEAFRALVEAFESLHNPVNLRRAYDERTKTDEKPPAKRARKQSSRAARTSEAGNNTARSWSWAELERNLHRYEELEKRFKSSQSTKYAVRRAVSSLQQAQRVCADLDERAGIVQNPLLHAEAATLDVSTQPEMAGPVAADPLHLLQLLLYLRETHLYCLFCGQRCASTSRTVRIL
eukprot:6180863-Pleurochrysis_carterae.AAC.2